MTDAVTIAHQVIAYQQWHSYYLLFLGLQARLGYEQILARRRAERDGHHSDNVAGNSRVAGNGRKRHL